MLVTHEYDIESSMQYQETELNVQCSSVQVALLHMKFIFFSLGLIVHICFSRMDSPHTSVHISFGLGGAGEGEGGIPQGAKVLVCTV